MQIYNTGLKPGDRLRASRTYAGMTMQQLADQVNRVGRGRRRCAKSVISDQERGEKGISPEYAEIYGQIFNVDPDYFTGASDHMSAAVKEITETAKQKKENSVIDSILAYAGYRIDRQETWSTQLMPEKIFYNVYRLDGSKPLVCLDEGEYYALFANIIEVVKTYMQTVIRAGKTLPDRIEELNQALIAAGSED